MNKVLYLLEQHGACPEATDWVRQHADKGAQWLWDNCPEDDWMAWAVIHLIGVSSGEYFASMRDATEARCNARDAAWDEYQAVQVPADIAYQAAIEPFREVYTREIDAATAAYRSIIPDPTLAHGPVFEAASEARRLAFNLADKRFQEAIAPVESTYQQAVEAAYQQKVAACDAADAAFREAIRERYKVPNLDAVLERMAKRGHTGTDDDLPF